MTPLDEKRRVATFRARQSHRSERLALFTARGDGWHPALFRVPSHLQQVEVLPDEREAAA